MASIVKILRAAADPTRLRILLLLKAEELSVAELQEILVMGQSTISTHLSQLKQAGLVEDRRTGKSSFYSLAALPAGTVRVLKGQDFSRATEDPATARPLGPEGRSFLDDLLLQAEREIPEAATDRSTMRAVVKKRQDKMRAFFDSMAGRLGKDYVPGKSWKSLAEALLRLMPPLVIADLGAGEGMISQLMAQRAKKVIAIDNSEKMVEVGSELARKHGIENLEYRLGDIEEVPIESGTVDLAFLSQALHHAPHPEKALAEAWRILKPGGRIAILDLSRHHFEEARELYADLWLGFTELELEEYLRAAGFQKLETAIVHREQEAPYLETMLVVGEKAAS